MASKSILFLVATFCIKILNPIIEHSYIVEVDQSFMFNKSLEWLMYASPKEIKEVVSINGFKRFSVTKENHAEVLYESQKGKPLDSIMLKHILESVRDFKKNIRMDKFSRPRIENFQWNDYLERTEVWEEGPVFVFNGKQLSHIWLDYSLK